MSETAAVRERGERGAVADAGVRAVSGVGVRGVVRGEVGGLQVGDLRGVYYATVMSQRRGAVFDET